MTRCACCHAGEGEALARCARCGTLLHADCLAWLGRCPTLGCSDCPQRDRPLSPLGRVLLAVARWLFAP